MACWPSQPSQPPPSNPGVVHLSLQQSDHTEQAGLEGDGLVADMGEDGLVVLYNVSGGDATVCCGLP